ncbi:hypothetical protein [Nocardia sp. NPDC050793]|uniref:phosphotriesterase family protein n=1 Tax=Nocardia sp. NPDC050793 TaxID=3155159 RepID=UPI00340DE650
MTLVAHDAACFIDWFPHVATTRMAPQWNYRHISEELIPALLAKRLTDDDIDAIPVRNPHRYFEK